MRDAETRGFRENTRGTHPHTKREREREKKKRGERRMRERADRQREKERERGRAGYKDRKNTTIARVAIKIKCVIMVQETAEEGRHIGTVRTS